MSPRNVGHGRPLDLLNLHTDERPKPLGERGYAVGDATRQSTFGL